MNINFSSINFNNVKFNPQNKNVFQNKVSFKGEESNDFFVHSTNAQKDDFDSEEYEFLSSLGYDDKEIDLYFTSEDIQRVNTLTNDEAILTYSPSQIKAKIDKIGIPELVAYAIRKKIGAEELTNMKKYFSAIYNNSEPSYLDMEDLSHYCDFDNPIPNDEINELMSEEKNEDGTLQSGLIRPLSYVEAAKCVDTSLTNDEINFFISKYPDEDFGEIVTLDDMYDLEFNSEFREYQLQKKAEEVSVPVESYKFAVQNGLDNDTFFNLIKVDEETQKPVSGASRVLTLEEAQAVIKEQVKPEQIETFIRARDVDNFDIEQAAFFSSLNIPGLSNILYYDVEDEDEIKTLDGIDSIDFTSADEDSDYLEYVSSMKISKIDDKLSQERILELMSDEQNEEGTLLSGLTRPLSQLEAEKSLIAELGEDEINLLISKFPDEDFGEFLDINQIFQILDSKNE